LSFRQKENLEQRGIEEEGVQSYPLEDVIYIHSPFPCAGSSLARATQADPSTPSLAQLPAQDSTEAKEISICCFIDFLIQDLAAEIWTVRNRRFLFRKVSAFWNAHTFGWYNQDGTVRQSFPHISQATLLVL
jgi:hypothetical protein